MTCVIVKHSFQKPSLIKLEVETKSLQTDLDQVQRTSVTIENLYDKTPQTHKLPNSLGRGDVTYLFLCIIYHIIINFVTPVITI